MSDVPRGSEAKADLSRRSEAEAERWQRVGALFDRALAAASPERVPLVRASTEPSDVQDEVLALLESLDPQQARIVELRYFGGLTVEEVADALEISPATVKRHWTLARAFLKKELRAE